MAKFKKGDKVRLKGHSGWFLVKDVKNELHKSLSGENYQETMYTVESMRDGYGLSYDPDRFGRPAVYDRVYERDLTLANSRACNAKFKVGDKVTDGEGVYLITGIDKDFDSYEWKFVSGRKEPSHSKGGTFSWADDFMKIANACRNAKFKVGDRVTTDRFQDLKGKVGTVVDVRDGRVKIRWPYGRRKEAYQEASIEEQFVTLANSVRSANPVVAKALNACARNGAYDTLEIRKDPRYGNNWCIYQEGVNVRAVSRVFDTPQSAKKYIREQMPAWADAKIRVKNAFTLCG